MKLHGSISKRFREKHTCEICEEISSTYKPKCYDDENRCDVEFTCKKCHDKFCCECQTDYHILWGSKAF